MFDNVFQLLWEYFLTLIWAAWGLIKDIAYLVKNHFFHRKHRFILDEVIGEDGESARCTICNRRLSSLVYHVDRDKSRFLLVAAVLISTFTSNLYADNFVGAVQDSIFLRDSGYVLKIAVTQSTCDAMKPCTVQIAGSGGGGTTFKNLFGNIGDTISVHYNFPDSQFTTDAARAGLFFFGSDGKAKDIWSVRLGFKDVKPGAIRARGRVPLVKTVKARYLANGRILR